MHPDFFLTNVESRETPAVRACFIQRTVHFRDSRDGILVDLEAPIRTENVTLGSVILVNRYSGDTLSPVNIWPMNVYVCGLKGKDIVDFENLLVEEIRILFWGQIFKELEEANNAATTYSNTLRVSQ